MERLDLTGYLASEGFETQLLAELGEVSTGYDRLLLHSGPPKKVLWAQNTWKTVYTTKFSSIKDAAKQLMSLQRNWALYPYREHRRAELIAAELPHVSGKPIIFPSPLPQAPLGSWTLIDRHTLLASPQCSSPFANGEYRFVESQDAPSRAYLKLWEALTRMQKWPQPGDKCLDVGSSPGGWTWALSQLGAEVISVDRSDLDPAVALLPNVHFQHGNAFQMLPTNVGKVDWIFSDVICYPSKLLDWVETWLQSGLCNNFVCTLKFQGESDYSIADKFLEMGGGVVTHLYHNKHELCWMKGTEEIVNNKFSE